MNDKHGFQLEFQFPSSSRAVKIPSADLREMLEMLVILSREVSRLSEAVRRPERVRYRPEALARRLSYNTSRSVRDLWNSGKLAYHKDGRGRYSTEAQVHAYERDYCHK